MVRYCDDWVILAKTREEAEQALQDAADFLAYKGLTLKPAKTRIVHHTKGFEFLGFLFTDEDGIHRKYPRKRAIDAYKDKIRHATRRNQPRNIAMLVEKLNPITRGWGLYFGIGDVAPRFRRLDEWTRSRLRSFLEKKRSTSLQMHQKYRNQYFRDLGLVFLSDLVPSSSPATGQRYR
jgi:RNA-directed DNA polymerase